MTLAHSKTAFLTLFFTWICFFQIQAQILPEKSNVELALRIIGHELLMSAGDSTSIILPVELEGERYKLSFANDFSFKPEIVVAKVNHIFAERNVSKEYLVEVEDCAQHAIVYNYAYGYQIDTLNIACGLREYPEDCYNIYFTLLDSDNFQAFLASKHTADAEATEASGPNVYLIAFVLILLGLIAFYLFSRNKKKVKGSNHLIAIGAFKFDKLNMELFYGDEKTVLTSKEADLLFLLYSSVNDTVERDKILEMVWEDQGDYVGRTLDVFISKLRKKLEADTSVKIVNIRGVGYKLILNA